jgi:hypothetical protein
MASNSRRKLALRRVVANVAARDERTIARRHAELMRTPDGRFYIGSQWTPEQISEMKRPDGFITLDPVTLNIIQQFH